MRPWVLMKQMDIGFDEHLVRFDGFTPESSFKKAMAELCPTGRVPVLVDSGLVIWDSLAIVEYLAERFPIGICGLSSLMHAHWQEAYVPKCTAVSPRCVPHAR